MLPDSIVRLIYDFVPHSTYDYMDGLVELYVIAEETGVTPLGRLQLERAMRRAYQPMDVDPPLYSGLAGNAPCAYLHARN